eukprot:5538311-Prymnesium_polylepis.1
MRCFRVVARPALPGARRHTTSVRAAARAGECVARPGSCAVPTAMEPGAWLVWGGVGPRGPPPFFCVAAARWPAWPACRCDEAQAAPAAGAQRREAGSSNHDWAVGGVRCRGIRMRQTQRGIVH